MNLNLSDLDLGWVESSGAEPPSFPLDPLDPLVRPDQPPALTVWGVALCVSGTFIAAENAIVVTTILASPSLRAPVFLLLASLGLADLLAGVTLVLHFLFRFCAAPPRHGDSSSASLVTSGLLVTSLTASLCSLMGVALDRYLSLSRALTYGSGESRRRAALLLLLLVWSGAAGIGAAPALGWHCLDSPASCSVAPPLTRTYLSLLCGGFLAAVAATLQLYAGICRVARRHAHAIATQRHFLPASQSYTKHGSGRGFSRLILVLSVFVGCWMPFSLWGLLGDASSPPLYTYATLVPAAGSSLLNPILYSLRNKDIRKVLVQACCPHRCANATHGHAPADV